MRRAVAPLAQGRDEVTRARGIPGVYGAIAGDAHIRPRVARFRSDDARGEAQAMVKRAGFAITPEALELLVESLGADIARIDTEIQKLALFANKNRILDTHTAKNMTHRHITQKNQKQSISTKHE